MAKINFTEKAFQFTICGFYQFHPIAYPSIILEQKCFLFKNFLFFNPIKKF